MAYLFKYISGSYSWMLVMVIQGTPTEKKKLCFFLLAQNGKGFIFFSQDKDSLILVNSDSSSEVEQW